MSEQITKEQLDSIMKSNPDFAKRIVSGSAIKDSTNPTRIFTTYEDAKAALGLAEFTLVKPYAENETDETAVVDIPERCYEFGSGVIQPMNGLKDYLESTVGKSMVSIALTGKTINWRKNIIDVEKDNGYVEVDYNKAIVPIRFCIVKKDEKGIFHTVSHLDATNMPTVGKYKVAKFKVVNDQKKDDPETNFTIFIESNEEKGNIIFSFDHTVHGIYIFPIVISKEAFDQNAALIKDKWDSNKEEFINRLVEGYSEEDKLKLIPYLSETVSNPNFSKALAVYNLENKKVDRIEDAIEANTKEIDTLNISAALFPRYGDEYIDFEKHSITVNDETKLPIITNQDINNLKIVGLKKEFITQILQAGSEAYFMAKAAIDADTEEERKRLTVDAYDAECRLIVDLGTNRWVDSLSKDFEAVANLFNHNSAIEASKGHIESVKQQLASLQLTSRRIGKKIEGGEFSNMYMQLCNNYMEGLYLKTTGFAKDDTVNYTPWVKFLQIINLRNLKSRDHVVERTASSLRNTSGVNIKRDKHGIVPVSLFDQAQSMVASIFDSNAIAENTPENEVDKKIMDLVFTRFNFIDSLSRTPYKFIARLYPEVFNLDPAVDIEAAKKNAEEYRNNLSLTDTVDLEGIRTKLCEIKQIVETGIVEWDWDKIRTDLNKLANSLSTAKCRGKYDKAKLFAKYFVLLNFYEYADTVATGYGKFGGTIEDAKKDKDLYVIEYDEKRYSIDEFIEFTNGKDVAGYVILKKLTDVESTNVILDWLLRSAMLSLFMQNLSWCEGEYIDYCESTIKDSRSKITEEYGKMFVSEIGLFVPGISVLETSGSISDLVPNDMKIKLGTNAVDDSLKGLDNSDNLKAARTSYLFESTKYVDTALECLLKYLRP